VKVLDFGLAKLTEKRKSDPEIAGGHHLSTETGMVMGTLNYMSPEQASGQEVDHRTDIFSLGVVFYEMATGTNPFKREHLAATLNAVLEEQPEPLSSSNPAVSFDLERIVARMLDKEKEFRYQTAADLRASLRRMQRGIDSGITASANKISPTQPTVAKNAVSRWWRRLAIALSMVSLLLLAAWFFFPRSNNTTSLPNWRNAEVTKITDQAGLEYFPSLSPDGKSLIYASDARGNFDIYLQRIGTNKTINLTKDSNHNDTEAMYSPDGTRIAFRSERNGGGIFVMKESGEAVRQLTNFGYNPAWSPDGKELVCGEDDIVFPGVRSKLPSRMWVVNVETGESRLISEGDAVIGSWSPNGKRIVYGATGLWTMRPDGSDAKPLFKDQRDSLYGKWSPDGKYLYYISSRNRVPYLWRVAIDEASADILGEPELIPTPASFIYHLTFSKDGKRLAFMQDSTQQNIYRFAFDPTTRRLSGPPESVVLSTAPSSSPAISPDGEVLIFEKKRKLFALKNNATVPEQLTEGTNSEITPRWSADGKHLAFQVNFRGHSQMFVMNADGSGRRQATQVPPPGAVYPIWSPDGTRLAYSIFSGKTCIIDLRQPYDQQTPEETPDFPNSRAYFIAWDWSPDGQYLVGNQGENGADANGLYIYSLATKTYEQIADVKFADLYSRPLWLNDSRQVLFSTREKILLVDIQTKKIQELYATGRTPIEVFSLTKDNRYIYASIVTPDSDIWMLSLE
jgi:Tol biopolymer transport system component